MTRDHGVPCVICGKVRYPQPERGVFTVSTRCLDCWRGEQAKRRAEKLAQVEQERAAARARQPALPGLDVAPPRAGLHGDGRRSGR